MVRRGVHIRGNRISGDTTRLNENAVKVLATIKFAPTSISREEIMQKTSLTKQDTERHVKLLLHYNLITNNRQFPQFPTLGWKVYTERQKHQQIIQILRQHGYTDPESQRTRDTLRGYYPMGMALEGKGRQPNRRRTYPSTVPINEDLEYRQETIDLMEKWKTEIKPFRPKEYSKEAVKERKRKYQWLTDRLSEIYKIRKPRIIVGNITKQSWEKAGSSGSSNYKPLSHTITINGKFSVLTLLHEYSHARSFDETDAVLWSVNLFKRTFPVSYSKLHGEGHTLQQENQTPDFNL
jgi:hypothetical protein